MKKYWDVDHERLWTEDELRADYDQRKRNGELEDFYNTFEYYLNCCLTINNGSLEEVAPDWMINQQQRIVAKEIATVDMPYGDVLEVIQKYNWFGNWSTWEINNRPVDIDELTEMVEQELGR